MITMISECLYMHTPWDLNVPHIHRHMEKHTIKHITFAHVCMLVCAGVTICSAPACKSACINKHKVSCTFAVIDFFPPNTF